MLAEIDGLAASFRTIREAAAPADLDDEAARSIARTLQQVLALRPAPVSGGAHAALLGLLG